MSSPAAMDRRGMDSARAPQAESPKTAPADGNSLSTLRAYRRAWGLYFKCGERWGRDHTCPATIQMHVLEELLDFVGVSATEGDEQYMAQEENEEVILAISLQAFNGNDALILLKLAALVQGKQVSLLIDSGSSTSFINARLVEDFLVCSI